ncbi:class I SAM-dependent methyltransferase [Microlunatus speluncae]|uniref:class I SAM-dependent methyltransferase n=1 Tax=Microlunatus speluncae TaxID=2594267 RepID=UPI0012668345|nr:class I SAM-dependent methyltransferase [Microlunatus speluncae]
MSSTPVDYDLDPADRRPAWDRTWEVASPDWDATGMRRIVAEDLSPVLDVGCGNGVLAESLPPRSRWIGLDSSPAQLAQATAGRLVRADARRLPFGDAVFGAVVCHWMLYHFDHPAEVITEAHRVLRPGGLFLASTSARINDPELAPQGYPATTFDAENAPAIAASVFGDQAVEVEAWDGPYLLLPNAAAVQRYVRHHFLPPEAADSVTAPLTLTKRGCFVWARKH